MNHVGEAPDGATVLVVEDDPEVASFLDKGLRLEGFQMDWVSTGTEAISRLDRGGADVMVLDLGLPDIDGLEVLRRARDRGITVPVVVVSGRYDPRDREIALSLGVGDFLTKPFGWTDLLAAIRAAVEQAPSQYPD
jgi:two-component system, OmpR family, KDP operon response regulator KdpE